MGNINIRNARLHNLNGIDISIPKNQLVVITGVSGSGKSSLAFDIVFEEGRKQYLQSLGILFGLQDERKFDSISGLGPAVAVQQSIIRQSNPRFTVGSRTQILNLLGVLFAAEGQINCSLCGTPLDENFVCSQCNNEEERLDASYFSYNAPNGMCIKCAGRGAYFEIDMQKLVPSDSTTVNEVLDRSGATPGYIRLLKRKFAQHLQTPFNDLSDEVKEAVIYGHHVNSNFAKQSACIDRILRARYRRFGPDPDGLYGWTLCTDCEGYRVGEEARRVHLNGKHIGELGLMTLAELHEFLQNLRKNANHSQLGRNVLEEILRKIGHLLKIRLGHLTLYREMPSLSGGEIQRLFLNDHLESKMDSLIYVLDEPTIGLHESEKAELLQSIRTLQELGNSVLVVEHDPRTISMADHIIDIGPKAGVEGGEIVFEGSLDGLLDSAESITGQYISGKIQMPVRKNITDISELSHPCLTLSHAKTNNLKDVTVSFPLGVLVGVAGLSGSGKSSLVTDTLIPLLERRLHDSSGFEDEKMDEDSGDEESNDMDAVIRAAAEKLEGVRHLSGFVEVTQAPIGRHMNSNPVTYIGIWDRIRKLFAAQPAAREQNLTAGHFSFNSKGACPTCSGSGVEKIWLGGSMFLNTTCRECNGKRFNETALSVRFKEKTINDVLEMSVSEAVSFFGDQKPILSTLAVLDRIGMGYIKLGQPTPTLSGGEAQRIKLAKQIGRKRKGSILYVLDEPTSGLSLYDTARLIHLLDELVEKGNSVIVIEHDPAVLSVCDWIIEMGPGGGVEGGEIIAKGTPRQLKQHPDSLTGPYLQIQEGE